MSTVLCDRPSMLAVRRELHDARERIQALTDQMLARERWPRARLLKYQRTRSSSVYYHEVLLETYGTTVDVNDPLPPEKEPTEAEANQYLEVLKDAMRLHTYFPQANASNGLEVWREIEQRNRIIPTV